MVRNIGIIICVVLFINNSFSQNIKLKGKVTDTINTPLAPANIIAEPKEDIPLQFAVANEEGLYELFLEKGKLYHITVSYLGYSFETLDIQVTENKTKDFILTKSSEQLDEITLSYTPPVVVKEDTISYRTDVFKTGEERKLRDILKKLPGVEVDRAGNVTVLGKRVTKVLVENKQFFTGDSKLAVNNIPADAVDKVEVLDNYNDVAMLKGLQDSEDMAMNIKLKANKKKFVFGDIETGIGVKKRYLIHPSLFYYSPKTTFNAIGDINNTGEKSFTLKDYLDFEGGINNLFTNSRSYFSLYNDDFAQFLGNRDFTASRNQFGAINLTQELSSKTELSTYGIWSKTRNETKSQSFNNYISSNNLIEDRINTGQNDNRFGIGKLSLKLNPNQKTDINFSTYVKASNNTSNQSITTVTNESNNIINTIVDGENTSIKQDISLHKRFSKKHTTSFVTNYHYQKTKPNTYWITDETILQGLIPIIDEETYNVFKNKRYSSHNINVALKHYWELNNFNHIYTTLGSQFTFDDYNTSEFQILEDNSINDFSESGFGNQTSLNFKDLFLGVHYKFKIGQVTYKPGIFYHKYIWSIDQDNKNINRNKSVLLPELTVTFKSKLKNRITLKYALKTRFPQISQFANRFTLLRFNSVYRGTQNLENERYHFASFNMNRFSIYKNIFYNFSITYKAKRENFKNTTLIEGIDYFSSPLLSNFEDKVWRFDGNLRKGFGNYMFSIRGNSTLATSENLINNELINSKSKSYAFGTGVKTKFKDFPNMEINYDKRISKYTSITNSKFEIDKFSVYLEYDFLKDFIFKADYSFESYNNKTFSSSSTFDLANASLFYQKEDSPWGIELTGNNLFGVKFKQHNSFSNILVSDEKTFILPRIIMFKIAYKL